MATDAATHRLRRPAAPAAAAHRPVHAARPPGRTPNTSDPSEEFAYV
jgi:hypothetical protein